MSTEEDAINILRNQLTSLDQRKDPKLSKDLKSSFHNILKRLSSLKALDFAIITEYISIIKDLSYSFSEDINSFMLNYINELSMFASLDKENLLLHKERINSIINFLYLIYGLTIGISQPNKILSNLLEHINVLLNKLYTIEDTGCRALSLIMITIITGITQNIQSYNPILITGISSLIISLIKDTNINNNDIEIKSRIDDLTERLNNSQTDTISSSMLISHLLYSLTKIMETYRNNINFDILFSDIVTILNKSILKSSIIKQINNEYTKYSNISINNKSVPIMFLILKPQEIKSLEPDWETYEERTDEVINKSMERKLKRNKRQLTRNLKKQSIIINQERNEKQKYIAVLREEDVKFRNQFLEQAALEAKQVDTSQNKKRFKLKKRK